MKKLVLSEKQYKKLQNISIEREILNEQSKSEIMIVQQRLKDCFNAQLGKSGPNKDGVDGIAGDRTKNAIETYTAYRFDTIKSDEGSQL
jgi:hypothetical protein